MDKHIKWGILSVCACLCVFLVAGTVLVLQGREALASGERSEDLQILHDILVQIHKPCQGSGKDKADNCGTISLANQVLVKSGDAIVATQVQEQGLIAQAKPILTAVAAIPVHANATFDGLAATSKALTGTANAATSTLNASTSTIKAAQPLLDSASLFMGDLNAETKPVINQANLFLANANTLATNPDVPGILHGFNVGLATGDHMLDTADKVEAKITKCTLYPDFKCIASGLIVPSVQIGGAAAAAFRK